MKLMQEWMSDYEYFGDEYPNNLLLSDAKARFEIQKQSLEGRDVLVDGVLERIVVQNHTNPLNQNKYDKKLSFNIDSNIHTGSLIEFDNKQWLLISKIFNKQAYKVGSVVECKNTLKLYKNQNLLEIPCIVSKTLATWQIDSNKYFSVPNNQALITIPNNVDTLLIDYNDIYKFGRSQYKVLNIDDITMPGLLILTVEFTTEEQPIIPDPPQPTEDMIITISGSSTIQKGKSATYTAEVTQNGVVIEGKTVLFDIVNVDGTDNVYATITSQDGVGCIVGAGQIIGKYVKIIGELSDDNSVVGEKVVQIVGLF